MDKKEFALKQHEENVFSSKSSAALMHFLYAYAAKTWMIS